MRCKYKSLGVLSDLYTDKPQGNRREAQTFLGQKSHTPGEVAFVITACPQLLRKAGWQGTVLVRGWDFCTVLIWERAAFLSSGICISESNITGFSLLITLACWDFSLKHWGSSEMLKCCCIWAQLCTGLADTSHSQGGTTPTQTSCICAHRIQTLAEVCRRLLWMPVCAADQQWIAVAVTEKRTAAGPSLRKIFKISAGDLQMTVNTWGKA